jgi:hypothetical protein
MIYIFFYIFKELCTQFIEDDASHRVPTFIDTIMIY